jgi:hypothetical protein
MGMENKVGGLLGLKSHSLSEVRGEVASFFTQISIKLFSALICKLFEDRCSSYSNGLLRAFAASFNTVSARTSSRIVD